LRFVPRSLRRAPKADSSKLEAEGQAELSSFLCFELRALSFGLVCAPSGIQHPVFSIPHSASFL
jgi:hypothetical protein